MKHLNKKHLFVALAVLIVVLIIVLLALGVLTPERIQDISNGGLPKP